MLFFVLKSFLQSFPPAFLSTDVPFWGQRDMWTGPSYLRKRWCWCSGVQWVTVWVRSNLNGRGMVSLGGLSRSPFPWQPMPEIIHEFQKEAVFYSFTQLLVNLMETSSQPGWATWAGTQQVGHTAWNIIPFRVIVLIPGEMETSRKLSRH